jgi:hypothetical protein
MSSPSILFEQQTKLPLTIVETKDVKLSSSVRDQLHCHRVQFRQNLITFDNDRVKIPSQFITSTQSSFEPLIMHNHIGFKFPKLSAGIKMPDEYYLDMNLRNAFIIEKKSQNVRGSVDEKIQSVGYKKVVLRKKFKPD